ncbi:MAG: alpha/beta fold hydrolase [Clostridia bacterium]|nr:alpha/beta fold hydrolase [Clostridia bacterium]
MGLFDLSVPELKQYGGMNPRPADFDTYWARGLDEMNAIDPEATMTPAYEHPAFDCLDLYFTGTKGARVYAKFVVPKHRTGPVPAVLQFHGYSGASGEWTGLFQLAASGFAVAALDVRGQGGLSEDVGGVKGNTLHGQIIRGLEDPDPDKLLFRDIFLDTAMLYRIVAGLECVDAQRIAVCGGSQGGGLSLACAALTDTKLVSICYPFLSDYQRVWSIDLAKDAYSELKEFFRHRDPTHSLENEYFTKLGYIDVQHLASRIRGKVRMCTGLMDTICPPSSQFAAFNKITSPKEVIFYPDFGHEYIPGYMDDTATWFASEFLNS